MAKEIERKFLVRQLPKNLIPKKGELILQGYLAIDSNGTEVRLRQRGNKYYQTVKSAGQVVRHEWEIGIAKNQFDALWPATIGRRLEKTRFKIPYANKIIELDIFTGRLKGLVLAEVEFPTKAEAKRFKPLVWLGQEVTNDDKFKNKNLIKLQLTAKKVSK